MRRKYEIKRKAATALAGCMTMLLLSGCADRSVDYDLEGETTERAPGSTLEQFAEAEKWNVEVSVSAENGSGPQVTVNAEIVLPEVDDMSVVEVEEAVVDGEYKKTLLTAFFDGGEVYYHDTAHCTREELEDMIAEAEESVSELRQDIEANPANYTGLDYDDWFDYQEGLLAEYRECLSDAKDTYTLAEDFDTCGQYVGERDGIWYGALFQERDGAGQTVSSIDILPMDGIYTGPESLKDFDEVMKINTDYMWTGGVEAAEEGTNECTFSKEEAKALADRFVDRIGRPSQVCYKESDLLWEAHKLKAMEEEGFAEIVEQASACYGYEFVYGTGVGETAFGSFGGLTAFDQFWTMDDIPENWYDTVDQISVIVTDAGITEVRMDYPVTIDQVTGSVELLPLETIQSILKNELEENGSRYDFSQNKYFNTLELIYFRLKDDSKAGSYSYVPAWCLCAKDGGTYRHAVLVNAIDGSVIYLQDAI